MKEYIEREVAIEDVDSLTDSMSVSTSIDMCLGMKSMKSRALGALRDIPAADVVEVDVKDFRMKKVIQMLSHYYSVAKKSGRSEDPLSYALYMTWRITDEMSKSRNADGGVKDERVY